MFQRVSGRRRLRWFVILFAAVVVFFYMIFPFAYGFYATVPQRDTVGAPPDGFQAVDLTASDGVTLAGWFAPPQNGAAIVLLHGSGDSRESVRAHAELLARHGFGVLAIDLRGHAESGGKMNRLGWQGTRDVEAAARFLLARDDVQVLGGLGLSVGGEILLGALSDVPALRAVVSEGATYRSPDEFTDLPEHRSLISSLQIRVMSFAVQLFSGERPPTPMLDSITAAEGAHLLLIAAGEASQEVDYARLFAEAAGPRATVWVAPGVGHTQAYRRLPAEYEARVIGFLEAALLGTQEPPAGA